ncbi:general transcription factor iif subunit [Anaeramoeba flamelloides]|uniref:General transcription factor iif subunit n=1 Tax=Anaeramoeba flamelloides TaxID=1746091 RepID=A0AAV7Y568_9EUKA|nr:general transcription factor iif subunit [Anaeramoeba flamelloides]
MENSTFDIVKAPIPEGTENHPIKFIHPHKLENLEKPLRIKRLIDKNPPRFRNVTKQKRRELVLEHERGQPFKLMDSGNLSFTGKYEGSNTSKYLILVKDKKNGRYLAQPINGWFSFRKDIHYKTLSAEQAEEKMKIDQNKISPWLMRKTEEGKLNLQPSREGLVIKNEKENVFLPKRGSSMRGRGRGRGRGGGRAGNTSNEREEDDEKLDRLIGKYEEEEEKRNIKEESEYQNFSDDDENDIIYENEETKLSSDVELTQEGESLKKIIEKQDKSGSSSDNEEKGDGSSENSEDPDSDFDFDQLEEDFNPLMRNDLSRKRKEPIKEKKDNISNQKNKKLHKFESYENEIQVSQRIRSVKSLKENQKKKLQREKEKRKIENFIRNEVQQNEKITLKKLLINFKLQNGGNPNLMQQSIIRDFIKENLKIDDKNNLFFKTHDLSNKKN